MNLFDDAFVGCAFLGHCGGVNHLSYSLCKTIFARLQAVSVSESAVLWLQPSFCHIFP